MYKNLVFFIENFFWILLACFRGIQFLFLFDKLISLFKYDILNIIKSSIIWTLNNNQTSLNGFFGLIDFFFEYALHFWNNVCRLEDLNWKSIFRYFLLYYNKKRRLHDKPQGLRSRLTISLFHDIFISIRHGI